MDSEKSRIDVQQGRAEMDGLGSLTGNIDGKSMQRAKSE